jgi:hypothetical protein
MKKTFVIMSVALIVLFITAMTMTSAKSINQKETTYLNNNSIPDSLNKIFINSCTSCHSDDSKSFAKSVLNFSNWDKYTKEEKIKKGDAICKMISEDKMPPESFVKSKPEAKLTDIQIKNICNWSALLSQVK